MPTEARNGCISRASLLRAFAALGGCCCLWACARPCRGVLWTQIPYSFDGPSQARMLRRVLPSLSRNPAPLATRTEPPPVPDPLPRQWVFAALPLVLFLLLFWRGARAVAPRRVVWVSGSLHPTSQQRERERERCIRCCATISPFRPPSLPPFIHPLISTAITIALPSSVTSAIHPLPKLHPPSPSPELGRRLSRLFASSAVGGWLGPWRGAPSRVDMLPGTCLALDTAPPQSSGDAAAPSLMRRSVASPILPRLRSCASGLFWVSCAPGLFRWGLFFAARARRLRRVLPLPLLSCTRQRTANWLSGSDAAARVRRSNGRPFPHRLIPLPSPSPDHLHRHSLAA
jgi:hypothetical protein